MTTVNWVLKDVTGADLGYQPPAGSPLQLVYKSSGRVHVAGYSSQEIHTIECTADTTTVSVQIDPAASSNPPLGESESAPVEEPGVHDGRYIWQAYSGNRVVLTFTVPESANVVWGWNFGNLPPIALKMKIRIKR